MPDESGILGMLVIHGAIVWLMPDKSMNHLVNQREYVIERYLMNLG